MTDYFKRFGKDSLSNLHYRFFLQSLHLHHSLDSHSVPKTTPKVKKDALTGFIFLIEKAALVPMVPIVNINQITMSTTFPFFQPISGFPNKGYRDFYVNSSRTTNTTEYFTDNSEQELSLNGIADFSKQMKQNWFCFRLIKPNQNKTNKTTQNRDTVNTERVEEDLSRSQQAARSRVPPSDTFQWCSMVKIWLVGFAVMYSFKECRSQNLYIDDRLPEADPA